ncbi:LysR family transcriptional regulator [Alteribacillus sp. YIM 98480]|uniref:LysR family transcriptional regulator n=1 Tax=Alteribacillus sp. YIM 98480 TaxID=2606599 RepID=UPI002106CD06|nr:LysR family transcriptional regulator [Alteribacillus sp. YIM 98480]
MLEYFLMVAKEKSISKAAHHLFVSQPALSKQIKKLEETLGFSLFVRSSKGISLTNKGQQLYDDMEPIIHKLQYQLKKHMNDQDIRMGSDPLLASYYFPHYIEKANPFKIKLTTIKDDTIELIPLLESGDIDAAIIQDHPNQIGLHSTFLFSDKFYAAVPVNHQLAREDSVSLMDCFKYTQLLPPTHTPLYKRIKVLLEDNAIPLPEIIELPYHALIGFAAQGYGISYLPSIMVEKIDYKGVVFIPLKDTPLKREMYLYALDKDTLKTLKLGFGK